MNYWCIAYKCLLLVYIAATLLYTTSTEISPWYMFAFLLYICSNLSAHILRKDVMKSLLLLLSITLIIAVAIYINPMFILLLPINVLELISIYTHKSSYALLLFTAPLFFLANDMFILYLFIALLSFNFYLLLTRYIDRVAKYKEKIELLNDRIDILTRNLHDFTEYNRQSEYMVKLEERNRISQQIHDKVGHAMTGALIQMEASRRLLSSDQEKASQLLQNAIQISKEGIESVRHVLKNTKPPMEQLGINRVRLLVDEFSSNHAIKAIFTYEGDMDLIMPIHWSVMIGNIQEALTNVLKYANATNVSIHIRVLRTLIRVEVHDNGKGADKVIKGLGIVGMEERAASIDGTVIVDGTNGFSVTTLLPITLKQHYT